jgi:catechol 2,3-dioxygenase-like lactoylglutathione lyase family enzyme
MFTHVMAGTNDIEASKSFYDAILGALGYDEGRRDARGRVFWSSPEGLFGITLPIDGEAACRGNGMTIGFKGETIAKIDAWHAAGVANGGTSCEDPPGVRGEGTPRPLYLAYLRDPDGNKLCAMHRMGNAG